MNSQNQFRRISSLFRVVSEWTRVAPSLSPVGVPTYRNLNSSAALRKRSLTSPLGNSLFTSRRTIMSSSVLEGTPALSQKTVMDYSEETLPESSVIIRFKPDDERFQMQVTLLTGKQFNFDRKSTDSITNVETRMQTNICKKMKKFSGAVKFLTDLDQVNQDSEIKNLFMNSLNGSHPLKVQIGDEVYETVFNPPEVYNVKFLNTYMPTFPLFPYRMETSDNFSKDKSLYKWEFSKDKPKLPTPPKLQKKSKSGSSSPLQEISQWKVCGQSFNFTPEKGMEGGYLRFTCIPSNGQAYGKPFSMVLANSIAPLTVESFLFHQRLSRLPAKPEEEGCLRVLSYNALADTYATPEWFISSPRESLDAGYRFPILNQEIKAYQADVICLQEVDEKYFEGNFEPFLSSVGYKGFHTSKVGNTKEGIATFHNPNKLTLLESFECVILEHMKTLFLWEKLKAVGEDFVQRLEDRNTVFHLSVFKVNNCQRETILLIGNVHLYFHPDADHIRLLQTITCINFLEAKLAQVKAQHEGKRVTVIFCGDLNCTPPFSSYRLLTTGKVEENDEDWSSHSEEKIVPGISFTHSLNLANSHPGEELTNITTCFEGCLDYILYQSEHFSLLETCPPPSKEEIARLTNVDEVRKVSLPNFYAPSDHLPIIADLKLKA